MKYTYQIILCQMLNTIEGGLEKNMLSPMLRHKALGDTKSICMCAGK